MKTILVLTTGGPSHLPVFYAALAAARPFHAHLEFLHLRLDAGEAALYTPHTDFAIGGALKQALGHLDAQALPRAAAAVTAFRQFCETEKLEVCDTPKPGESVTAFWHEEIEDVFGRLMERARRADLIVCGRVRPPDHLPHDLVERVLMESGRPVLLAGPTISISLTGSVLVCWKESAESARALAAAMPLLMHSKNAVLLGIGEESGASDGALSKVAESLAWHGIAATVKWVEGSSHPVASTIQETARECRAELIVMGAYGRSRTHETIFGGCTKSFLTDANQAILMMH
ncbi:MAG: universal stress protein [Burkholderiaceae bacterium]